MKYLRNQFFKVFLIRRVGLKNVILNLSYKIKKGFPLSSLRLLRYEFHIGELFEINPKIKNDKQISYNDSWEKKQCYFSWYHKDDDKIPSWHNLFTDNTEYANPNLNWFEIPLNKPGKDIKFVWEASRMEWLITFSQLAALGDFAYINKINSWVKDWMKSNPPYKGVNWTCAQECSIRILNFFCSLLILNQNNLNTTQEKFIKCHLRRIALATSYSKSQQNNHATSEGAALYIGGLFLEINSVKEGRKWKLMGRKMLEEMSSALISRDGSFSQSSTNYHRLMLDTFSLAEIWNKKFSDLPFSENLKDKMSLAADWIYNMCDLDTGLVPNLGGNDGAYLLKLLNNDYSDFRPSIKVSLALFQQKDSFSHDPALKDIFLWLGIEIPSEKKEGPISNQCEIGGTCVIRSRESIISMKYPRIKFRPSQNDLLHLDLIIGGLNILKDSGTYSYDQKLEGNQFSGVSGHNTVEFDDQDQLRKLSNFMYLDWLDSENINALSLESNIYKFSAGYTDHRNNTHLRSIIFYPTSKKLIVKDKISGPFKKATLRWRLPHDDWIRDTNKITNSKFNLEFKSDSKHNPIKLQKGYESRYYFKREPVYVAEFCCYEGGEIESVFSWT